MKCVKKSIKENLHFFLKISYLIFQRVVQNKINQIISQDEYFRI